MRAGNVTPNNKEPELHETLIRPLVELFLGVILLLIIASAFAFAEPAPRIDSAAPIAAPHPETEVEQPRTHAPWATQNKPTPPQTTATQ